MLGSGNISGSPAMHVMTGNLSHQIEHHLFPDMPSNRYAEIAPRIRDLMERHELPYVTGSLGKQAASVYWKVVQLSLPNKVGAAVAATSFGSPRRRPGARSRSTGSEPAGAGARDRGSHGVLHGSANGARGGHESRPSRAPSTMSAWLRSSVAPSRPPPSWPRLR